jgi:uncharacterized protein YraI
MEEAPMRHAIPALVFLVAGAAIAQAQTALQADGTVNVRSGPGTGYGIIGQVPDGHTYVGFQQSGEWWKIYYNGGTGWTHGAYYTPLSGTTGVKVTTDVLNVRSGPSTGYSILGKVYMGQIHFWTAHESIAPWYRIYWGGRVGYVHGDYVTRVALSGGTRAPPPPSGSPTNLAVTHFYQVTNYFCGPASAQTVVHYLTGRTVSQWTIASYCGTSPSYGTSNWMVKQAINHYGGTSYRQVSYNGERLRGNIRSYRPSNVNMQCRYLAYWGYSWAMHHSVVKGYTSGGFYIHDTWKGPNKWASSTELYNAVVYHYNLTAVRY